MQYRPASVPATKSSCSTRPTIRMSPLSSWLGTLPARGARYFLSSEIDAALTSNSTFTPSLVDNSGPGGITTTAGQALPANTRLRISSNAASTLRVQSYIYNATTRALVEVSASQGADFVNVEAAPRDHIDQDAQTGIKK